MAFRRPFASLALLLAACSGSSSTTTTARDAGEPDAKAKTEQDAGDTDAKSTKDSGFTPGKPLTATPESWTWVPFDNAFCADGSTTGIGVNLSSTPDARVLLYLEGGGACWSDVTCYTLMTASYFATGYGPAEFATESADVTYLAEPGGFFDRTAAENPFKDYSYVYVPYCTGDVHAGNNVTTYGTNTAHFVGYANMGAYLERLVPTFPDAPRVILAGSSAGGFGAAVNWSRTQDAFGKIRVDLIDDSGTAMPQSVENMGLPESTLVTAWNLGATLPAGCTTCSSDLSSLYAYYDTVFAKQRGSLLSYVQDSVLPTFFGVSEAEFSMGLQDDITSYFQPNDPLKAFTINASGHVLFFTPQLETSAGVTVQQFVTQMVTDDPSWANTGP